jgi:hypothetical protein
MPGKLTRVDRKLSPKDWVEMKNRGLKTAHSEKLWSY